MFAIEVSATFKASHQLRLPARLGGGLEPLHDHDWHITVCVESATLDDLDTVTDFHLVEKALAGVITPWRGRHLNDIAPFDHAVNPSAERVAERIAELLAPSVAGLVEVRITEAPGCVAIWRR